MIREAATNCQFETTKTRQEPMQDSDDYRRPTSEYLSLPALNSIGPMKINVGIRWTISFMNGDISFSLALPS